MKRDLTIEDVEPALIGGAILGGGGGGIVETGREAVRVAMEVGTPQLWSADEFAEDDLTATIALVGAPAAPNPLVLPRHMLRTLELLREQLPPHQKLAALHCNENGAYTTFNGWLHSALTGLPIIDFACNGRAQPTSVMGGMGLHLRENYQSLQAFAGGHPDNYVEGVLTGALESTSDLVRRASVAAGGWIGVARNPVTVGYAMENGAPGAISQAIELGRVHIEGGVEATAKHLGGRIVAEGTVKDFRLVPSGGRDHGLVALDNAEATTVHFINEYMVLTHDGARISRFPELIMTFAEDGRPVTSGEIAVGDRITVMVAPVESLILSKTMFMPDLYEPLEQSIGFRFAPGTEDLAHA
ncbi:DUF917 family protein [Streptomyces sp. NPDC051840]|uniref:S-methyl thiohydantoin desulfurase domain-containing protein n=1 Tax=unclassified Streptomyces TaxID=2593676 RepID=UPI003433046A